jgi:hypothetical protein
MVCSVRLLKNDTPVSLIIVAFQNADITQSLASSFQFSITEHMVVAMKYRTWVMGSYWTKWLNSFVFTRVSFEVPGNQYILRMKRSPISMNRQLRISNLS